MSTDKKRKLTAEPSDSKKTAAASKRIKTGGSSHNESSTQKTEDDGAGAAGEPAPPAISPKHPVNIQNAVYAAERLSCSLDITHSLNFILRGEILLLESFHSATHSGVCVSGSTLYITWSDRESVIRTGGFDILDSLPHFLLVLLIIQRFDLGRWGFFTGFPGSPIHPNKDYPSTVVLEATFEGRHPIYIFPIDDPVYGGINLSGRSTVAAGAREKPGEKMDLDTSGDIRDGNDMIVKFSWPYETRVNEAVFIEDARVIGEDNLLVKDHIPTMLGNMDPPYLTCSTKNIRKFLGLDANCGRVLRIIAFRRLEEIKSLPSEDMLIAFLDCFFCRFSP